MFKRCLFTYICGFFLLHAATGCAAQAAGISRLGYAIQVGAFSEVKNAERLSNRLQEKGIEAFYFRKENGIYAVRFGDFATRDQAQKSARRLVSDRMISSYFIAPPQKLPAKKAREASWRKAPEPTLTRPAEPGDRKRPEKLQRPSDSSPRGRDDMGNVAARTAERFVGIPYRWGGENVVDGMDCSGFVRAVYNLCGVNIPRTSREQFRVGENITKDELKDGDLVFFGASADQINHVGIYTGNGRFVHAPRRGDDIKVSALDESYFVRKFIGAKRYF